jgi:chemotaxis signal transduction protein
MRGEGDAAESVEVLLFEIGGRRYGVDAGQVEGIGGPGGETFKLPALGPLRTGKRALLFDSGPGQSHGLQVDSVEGVRQARVVDLRRMPDAVRAHPYTVGVWLRDEEAVMLIDLNEGQKFQESHEER